MNILIVDDSAHIQTQLKLMLNSAGYKDLSFANSAKEAYELLGIGSGKEPSALVDLILMDVEMEEENGIAATRRIKSEVFYGDLPVLMVTADTSSASLQASFDAGAVDYITKPIRKIELLARVKSFLKLKSEIDAKKIKEKALTTLTTILEQTNKQLKEANQRLAQMAVIDGLTGISNRRFFEEVIEKEWRRHKRSGISMALLMIDIDFFKAFNDTYGHQQGDECLKLIAQSLKASLDRSGDIVARYGGEEFVVVLPETDAGGAEKVCRKIQETISDLKIRHVASDAGETVTVSIGISAIIPKRKMRHEELVSMADNALYQAKQQGRNRYVFFEED